MGPIIESYHNMQEKPTFNFKTLSSLQVKNLQWNSWKSFKIGFQPISIVKILKFGDGPSPTYTQPLILT